MYPLPNILLPQSSASTVKNTTATATTAPETTDFPALLRQTLPEGTTPTENRKPDENQLMPSRPEPKQEQEQKSAQPRPTASAQLMLLSQQVLSKLAGNNRKVDNTDINGVNEFDCSNLDLSHLDLSSADLNSPELNNLDINVLSQLSAPLSQMLAANTPSELTGKTDNDNPGTDELAIMNVLLAMLPAQTTRTPAAASTNSGTVQTAVITEKQQILTPATVQDMTDTSLTELAEVVLPAMPGSGSNGSTASMQGAADAQRNNSNKVKVQAEGKQQGPYADLNKLDTNHSLYSQNSVLPVTGIAQSIDSATASRHGAELMTRASTVPSPLVQPTFGTVQWQQAIGQQITLFSHQGLHSAELRLHPADLGSVKISIKLDENNLAQLQLLSAHSHVRAALEAALPVLRIQLAESGIQLGQSHIGSENFNGQQFTDQQFSGQTDRQQQSGSYNTAGNPSAVAEPLATPDNLAAMVRGDSAVDTFV